MDEETPQADVQGREPEPFQLVGAYPDLPCLGCWELEPQAGCRLATDHDPGVAALRHVTSGAERRLRRASRVARADASEG